MPKLAVGDLILDNLGREGVVLAPSHSPSPKWLADQDDLRTRSAAGPWWKVAPLDGGGVLVPEDLAVVIRRASVDDVVQLMNSDTSDNGAAILQHLFAELRSPD